VERGKGLDLAWIFVQELPSYATGDPAPPTDVHYTCELIGDCLDRAENSGTDTQQR